LNLRLRGAITRLKQPLPSEITSLSLCLRGALTRLKQALPGETTSFSLQSCGFTQRVSLYLCRALRGGRLR
jgi:hypothetical protein